MTFTQSKKKMKKINSNKYLNNLKKKLKRSNRRKYRSGTNRKLVRKK